MMTLGSVLQALRNDPDPVALLSEDFDLLITARARAAADSRGETLGQYMHEAVAAFLDHADEEEWAQLVGRLQNGDCSTATCLNLMLRRRLRLEADGAAAA